MRLTLRLLGLDLLDLTVTTEAPEVCDESEMDGPIAVAGSLAYSDPEPDDDALRNVGRGVGFA